MKQKVDHKFNSQQKAEALKYIPVDLATQLYKLEKAAIDRRFIKSISYGEKSNMFHLASSAWGKTIKCLSDLPEQVKFILIVEKIIIFSKEAAFYSYKEIVDNNTNLYEQYLTRELIALSFCCMVGEYNRIEVAKKNLLTVAIKMRDNLGEIETGLLFLKIANDAIEGGANNISAKFFYELAVHNLKGAYCADRLEPTILQAYHQALQGFLDGLYETRSLLESGKVSLEGEEYDECARQLKETNIELQNFAKTCAISDSDISDGSSVTAVDTSDISNYSGIACESADEGFNIHAKYIQSVTPHNTLRHRKRF